MSTVVPGVTSWRYPAEVVKFAAQQGVERYLEPLREALGRAFPTAERVRVLLEDDPEIRDDWHIVFEVYVAAADVPDYLAATRPWYQELFGICPAPLAPVFRMSLLSVEP
jgi:hypothetical protein